MFALEVVQDSKNVSVARARGATPAELLAHAQEIAEEFSEDCDLSPWNPARAAEVSPGVFVQDERPPRSAD